MTEDTYINPDDLKNSIIILALDNLVSLYEYTLESVKDLPKEDIEYFGFIIDYSRDLMKQMGQNLDNHITPRPEWKTK